MTSKSSGKKSSSPILSAGLGVVAIVAVTQGNYGGAVFALLVALLVAAYTRYRSPRVK